VNCTYIAVPAFRGLVPHSFPGLSEAARRQAHTIYLKGSSLLAHCFNEHLRDCLNQKTYTHFALHHDDLQAPPGWLDHLHEVMEDTGATVVSAVVAIKDLRGVTSTGWQDPMNGNVRRITTTELMALPGVIKAEHSPLKSFYLAVNTGLTLIRIGEWMKDWPGFQIQTQLRFEEDQYRCYVMSEDWGMSHWLQSRGHLVVATKHLNIVHHGSMIYETDHAWGKYKTDEDFKLAPWYAKVHGGETS